jgi:hypothetical protein
MSGAAASVEDPRIDADAIVANAQGKVQFSKGNFCFYILRLRVTERIAQGLTGKAVDLVAENGIQGSCLTFYQHAELRGMPRSGQFLAYRSQGLWQIVGDDRGGTQVLHRTPGLGQRLIPLIENLLQCLLRLLRVCRQHMLRRLQIEKQPLKALQQRVMEFASDAGANAASMVKGTVASLPFHNPSLLEAVTRNW